MTSKRRIIAASGVVAVTASMLVGIALPAAATSGTGLFTQSFTTDSILPANGAIVVPSAPVSTNNPGGTNSACLTVTQTTSSPLPNCTPTSDASGSGALQLTANSDTEEGGVFAATSVPAAQGLDVSFNSSQYGGSGADGITFVLAAVDPSNPLPPTTIGQAGGSLGYSAQGAGNLPGLADGYLGLGLDTFGNFSNPVYEGTGCAGEPTGFSAANPNQVVVRGPGHGLVGYCGLQTTNTTGLHLDSPGGSGTRANSNIPVEVVINTTSAAITTTADPTLSVPVGDYAIVFTPIGGSMQHLLGALPTVSPTFYGANTSSWIDGNGIPKQLAFGWVASTGGSKDTHEINDVQVSSINAVPKLDVTQNNQDSNSAAHTGTVPDGNPVTYTVNPSVDFAGQDENSPVTVTDTLPAGVTPTTAGGDGWVCDPPSGQQVSCTTDTSGPFTAGTALPPLYINGAVTNSGGVPETTIETNTVVTASSNDADPGYAQAAIPTAPDPAITDLVIAPNTGPATTSTILSSATDAAELAKAFQLDIDGIVLARCSGNTPDVGCFNYDTTFQTLGIVSMPVHPFGPVAVSVVARGTASTPVSYTYTEAPLITTNSLPDGEVGVAYSQALGSTDATLPLTWNVNPAFQAAFAATGLTLNTSTGVISGTPTVASTGTYGFDFADSDSSPGPQISPVKQLSLTINAAPAITTPSPLPTGYVGTAYSQQLATSGGVGPWTWSITGALPAGLSFNTTTGVISGTPTVADTGAPTSFTAHATDANSIAATPVAYTLAVLATAPSGGGGSFSTVPSAPQGSVDSQTGSGTNPTATSTNPSNSNEKITVTGTGSGDLRVSTLGSSPTGVSTTDPAVSGGSFYTVALGSASTLTNVDVTVAGTPATSLYWWNGTAWQKVPGVTRTATGALVAHVTATSSPNLTQLSGATFAAGSLPITRVAGSNRIGTSVAASLAAFPTAGSASAVVLARDDVFADALTGGPLAAAKNAPVLLTDPSSLLTVVAAEISRVLPAGGTVYLLGGTSALSVQVAESVTSDGFHAVRISGSDRFATSVAIAGALGNPSTVFEATGLNFPDAMSAGPAAIKAHGAIVLTDGAAQGTDAAGYLAAHKPAAVYAVGGAAASANPAATKLVGADRYATAVDVATAFFTGPTQVGLATGADFADALVAAPALGKAAAPLLLTSPTSTLPPAVSGYLTTNADTIAAATVYGGTSVLSSALESQVQADTP